MDFQQEYIEEVKQILKKLKPKKSSGYDGLLKNYKHPYPSQ